MVQIRLIPCKPESWPNGKTPSTEQLTLAFAEDDGKGELAVGRAQLKERCDIEDKKLSRKQLVFKFDPQNKSFVAVCDALNASTINGAPLQKQTPSAPLRHGDIITLMADKFAFRVEMDPPPAASNKRRLLEDEDSTQEEVSTAVASTTTTTTTADGELPTKKQKVDDGANDATPAPAMKRTPSNVAPMIDKILASSASSSSKNEATTTTAVSSTASTSKAEVKPNTMDESESDAVFFPCCCFFPHFPSIHPVLLHVKQLSKVCPNVGFFYDENAGNQRCFVVRMSLDTSFLERYAARQWGLTPKKPIVIQIKFDFDYLWAESTGGSTPLPVFVFQSNDPKLNSATLNDYETDFGVVQFFLETRLNSVLRKNLCHKPERYRMRRAPSDLAPLLKRSKSAADATKLTQLVEMGFERAQVEKALKAFENDNERALTFLLEQQSTQSSKALAGEPAVKRLVDAGFTQVEALNALDMFGGNADAALQNLKDVVLSSRKLTDADSTEHVTTRSNKRGRRAAPVTPKRKAAAYTVGGDSVRSAALDIEDEGESKPLDDTSIKSEEENLWKEGDGLNFLVNLYNYINLRFITAPARCLICDRELDFSMYKLPVCKRRSCVKTYETSSVGTANVIHEIKT
jgi:hypothetical protein